MSIILTTGVPQIQRQTHRDDLLLRRGHPQLPHLPALPTGLFRGQLERGGPAPHTAARQRRTAHAEISGEQDARGTRCVGIRGIAQGGDYVGFGGAQPAFRMLSHPHPSHPSPLAALNFNLIRTLTLICL